MDKKKLSRVLNVLDRIDREIGGLSELLLRNKYLPIPVPVKSSSNPRR
jgi:hypothetical protein